MNVKLNSPSIFNLDFEENAKLFLLQFPVKCEMKRDSSDSTEISLYREEKFYVALVWGKIEKISFQLSTKSVQNWSKNEKQK